VKDERMKFLRSKRGKLGLGIVIILVVLFTLLAIQRQKVQPLKRSQMIMGTMVEITVIPPHDEAIKAAFEEIQKVDTLMSIYKENSEISILNREGKNHLSIETLQVIREAINFSKITGGAFDITCKPLINLWKKAKKEKVIPSPEETKKALSLVGYEKILLEGEMARFKQKGMQIDLGGIAKGYAVDRAIEALRKNGIRRALINAGGDLYALGNGPGDEKWKVGIQDPREEGKLLGIIKVKDVGVATSGDYRRYFTIEGKRFSHIVNPKTGQTVQDVPMSVTVIAPDATTTDALATGIFVLGPQAGMKLIDSLPQVEGMIVGEGMKPITSKGWAHFQD
jgi:thiamine biosynthesis lipoprotein